MLFLSLLLKPFSGDFHSTYTVKYEKVTCSCVHAWTYPNEGPVPKVVDGAEEPELVEEEVRPGYSALVWKTQQRPNI